MKVFDCGTHKAYELRRWTPIKSGFVIIRETGNRKNAKTLWNWKNLRFIIKKNSPCWHWFIRTPIFYFYRHNCGFEIGHQNLYLWKIK